MIIGREAVLADVARRLRESRLVTITGPGGIGKTTVADATARAEAHRYPLGSLRVDLTLVEDDRDVGAAMAAQLGFGSFRALLDSPSEQPALVVMDNCEHVLAAAADAIEALLDACASPTVIATSRSPLGVKRESIVVLAPLELPSTVGDEQRSPAVQLFLERARDGGAVIGDADVAAVGRLCGLLDGVPLAIELAAARSRVLTPDELLGRLGDLDTFRLARSRGAARHRSLRDTIAWSYALLDEEDQEFFDRLSVLSGPFTMEDAEAVGGSGDRAATIDRLDRLVADSLLATSVVAGVTHYRQLEVVRAYARERLVDAGRWDATWQRFVDRVVRRSMRLATEGSARWDRSSLATLLSRVDQHLAALRWCLDHDDAPDRSFLLVATLWGVVHQGRVDEVAPLAERALERWDDPSREGWADAVATVATCRYLSGHADAAIELAERALPFADAAHFAPCTLRRVIGHASVAVGDLAGAVDVLSAAIDIARDRVPALASEMTVSRAELTSTLAEGTAAAAEVISQQLTIVRAVAADASRAGGLVNEIWARSVEATLVARSDPEQARLLAERALSAAVTATYPAAESVNLHTLATLAIDSADLAQAASLTRRLIDGLVARGADGELRNGLHLAAVVLERAGDPTWKGVAATAGSLPVVSLFSVPGHERHALPPSDGVPTEARVAVSTARVGLDAVSSRSDAKRRETAPIGAAPHGSAVRNEWCCEGDMWRLTYDGHTVHVRSSKGLASIGRLLGRPDTDLHCLDLADAAVDDGVGGEVIDARARRDYEQRVRDLQAEIDEADAHADIHRATRARAELDAIVDHLTAALGLGGRVRRDTGTVERARSAVTQRIRSTIRRLRATHPSLADHLEASIQTGVYCRYRPERSTEWSTAGPEP